MLHAKFAENLLTILKVIVKKTYSLLFVDSVYETCNCNQQKPMKFQVMILLTVTNATVSDCLTAHCQLSALQRIISLHQPHINVNFYQHILSHHI